MIQIQTNILKSLIDDILNHPHLLTRSIEVGHSVPPIDNVYLDSLLIYVQDELNDINIVEVLKMVKNGDVRPYVNEISFNKTVYMFSPTEYKRNMQCSTLYIKYFNNMFNNIHCNVVKDTLVDIWRMFYYGLFNV